MFLGAEVCSKRLVEIGTDLVFTEVGGADEDLYRFVLIDASEDMVKELRRRCWLRPSRKQVLVEKADRIAHLLLPLVRAFLEKDRPDNILYIQ